MRPLDQVCGLFYLWVRRGIGDEYLSRPAHQGLLGRRPSTQFHRRHPRAPNRQGHWPRRGALQAGDKTAGRRRYVLVYIFCPLLGVYVDPDDEQDRDGAKTLLGALQLAVEFGEAARRSVYEAIINPRIASTTSWRTSPQQGLWRQEK